MTCIVGVRHEGKVYIGADSAGVDTWRYGIFERSDRKVFTNGKFVMGFTQSFRMGQLLNHALNAPNIGEDEDVMKFMVTTFINAVRQCLKDGGYAEKKNEVEAGGVFLVGFKSRLFTIDSDYQVGEVADGYDALGCGDHFALGSLHATSTSEILPRERIEIALRAAAHFSAGVRGPFHIEVL